MKKQRWEPGRKEQHRNQGSLRLLAYTPKYRKSDTLHSLLHSVLHEAIVWPTCLGTCKPGFNDFKVFIKYKPIQGLYISINKPLAL